MTSRKATRAWIGAAMAIAALSASCWAGDRLLGKACDYEHPCFDGYRCVEGNCLYDRVPPPKDGGVDVDEVDGGPLPGGGTVDGGEVDAGPDVL